MGCGNTKSEVDKNPQKYKVEQKANSINGSTQGTEQPTQTDTHPARRSSFGFSTEEPCPTTKQAQQQIHLAFSRLIAEADGSAQYAAENHDPLDEIETDEEILYHLKTRVLQWMDGIESPSKHRSASSFTGSSTTPVLSRESSIEIAALNSSVKSTPQTQTRRDEVKRICLDRDSDQDDELGDNALICKSMQRSNSTKVVDTNNTFLLHHSSTNQSKSARNVTGAPPRLFSIEKDDKSSGESLDRLGTWSDFASLRVSAGFSPHSPQSPLKKGANTSRGIHEVTAFDIQEIRASFDLGHC